VCAGTLKQVIVCPFVFFRHRKQTSKTTKQDGGYAMKRQRSFSNPTFMEQNINTLAYLYQVRVIAVFTVFRLLTDFVCLYNYEFGLSLSFFNIGVWYG
jgi:hypothetical protein